MKHAPVLLLVACASAPPALDSLPAPADHDWSAAAAAAEDLAVRSLEADGVRGGEIAAKMPGPADRVAALLLDFAHADGRRAWAQRHTAIQDDGATVVARWEFKGKLGIAPSIEIEFETVRHDGEIVIRYRQREGAFGLAAFFGDYRIRRRAAEPDHCMLIERVFIDSGLPFVGASAEDIAAGLREDIRRIRAWLREGGPVSCEPRSKSQENPQSTL